MPGTLTHSAADVIRQLLVDLGYGTAPADSGSWPVYVSQEPDRPDNCITVYDTTAIHQGREQIEGEVQEREAFQIRLRCANHRDGHEKIRTITIALDQDVYDDTVVVLGSDTYNVHAISRTSGPIALGKEVPESKRDVFTLNCTAVVRQTS